MRTPRKAVAFLRWFCREDCIDELEGDLMEFFHRECLESPRRARWLFRWRVLTYFRPEFLKGLHRPSSYSMYKNYLTTAWRALLGSRLNTALNIIGLSIGISACIVIYNIVSFELSFNRDVPDGSRIYRVYSQFAGTYDGTNCGVASGLQAMVKTEFSGLEKAVNFETFSAKVIVPATSGMRERSFEEQYDPVITGPEYFDLIQGFEWTAGDAAHALSLPFQVVLTEEKAAKYFGTRDFSTLMGREIHYQDSLVLYVAGIVKPPVYKTDFVFTDFISMITIEKSFLKKAGFQESGWGSTNGGSQLFIKLLSGTSTDNIQQQLRSADSKYKESNPDASFVAQYRLQPLSDLHFNEKLGSFDASHVANRRTLLILALVGVMLLIIAAINFINLETAQASRRAKEVGVRKVLGGVRSQLISQFMAQSLLVTTIATALSVVLAQVSLNLFSDYIPAGVTLHLLSLKTFAFFILVIAVVGVLAGFYPAIVMSSYLPVKALKNQTLVAGGRMRSSTLRRALIVFQFSFAQVLIIGTMVMISQINFLLDKDLGFEKDAILTFHAPFYERPEKILTLRNELQRIPELERVTIAGSAPSASGRSSTTVTFKAKEGDIKVQVYHKGGDENFMPMFGLKLVSGRGLTSSDTTTQVIINETYLKQLHLKPGDAIGQEIRIGKTAHTIIGVVRDFNTVSLREGMQPVYINNEPKNSYVLAVKLYSIGPDGSNLKAAMAGMETAWKKVFPEEHFSAEFYDQTLAAFYKTEQNMSRLTAMAMAVAILICCLGLFGLVSFSAASRTKEIGVRKVLGASIGSIVILLSKDIVYLVAIAFVIAVPVSYYGATRFLEEYAFHMSLTWWLFAGAGGASVLLALATASQQAIKAAMANPVDSLKAE